LWSRNRRFEPAVGAIPCGTSTRSYSASGPWTDEVRALVGEPQIIEPTKGVHLVVDSARLSLHHAIVMLARADHRVVFAIPWGLRTIIGTTDTFYEGSLNNVFATRDDADYLLETANHYFPAAQLTRNDVLATWAGLRPLIAPDTKEVDASDVSREHTYRDAWIRNDCRWKTDDISRIAAEVVDCVSPAARHNAASTTAERSLPGVPVLPAERNW